MKTIVSILDRLLADQLCSANTGIHTLQCSPNTESETIFVPLKLRASLTTVRNSSLKRWNKIPPEPPWLSAPRLPWRRHWQYLLNRTLAVFWTCLSDRSVAAVCVANCYSTRSHYCPLLSLSGSQSSSKSTLLMDGANGVSTHLLLHAGKPSIFSAGCPGRRRPVETQHSRHLQQQTEEITLDWVWWRQRWSDRQKDWDNTSKSDFSTACWAVQLSWQWNFTDSMYKHID